MNRSVLTWIASAVSYADHNDGRMPWYTYDIRDTLPRGSGFDRGCEIVWAACREDRIVIRTWFHHLDVNGFYCGWSSWTVKIRPGFDGPQIRISMRDTRNTSSNVRRLCDDSMRDYVHDVFDRWTETTINPTFQPPVEP